MVCAIWEELNQCDAHIVTSFFQHLEYAFHVFHIGAEIAIIGGNDCITGFHGKSYATVLMTFLGQDHKVRI